MAQGSALQAAGTLRWVCLLLLVWGLPLWPAQGAVIHDSGAAFSAASGAGRTLPGSRRRLLATRPAHRAPRPPPPDQEIPRQGRAGLTSVVLPSNVPEHTPPPTDRWPGPNSGERLTQAAPGEAAAPQPLHPPGAGGDAGPAGAPTGETPPQGEGPQPGDAGGETAEAGPAELENDLEAEFGQKLQSEGSDPLSGYNRAITTFNDTLYFWFFRPVAIGYRAVVPEFARRGVLNFFRNLLFPVRFVNNVLQLKVAHAGEELLRFSLNTTVGVLGLWDPAKVWFGLEPHEEDFGQTLGFYGVGPGPHLVLPFLGPSNLRDTLALVPDFELDPVGLVEPPIRQIGVRTYDELNKTSLQIGQYENLKKDALDLYPFLRDVYEQNRNKQIAE